MLTEPNKTFIENCHAILGLYNAVHALFKENILTQDNLDCIKKLYWYNPNDIARVLVLLAQSRLLTSENRNAIKKTPSSSYYLDLLKGIQIIKDHSLLDDNSLKALLAADKPKSFAIGYCKRDETPWLTEQMFEVISQSDDPEISSTAFNILQTSNLVQPEHIDVIRQSYQADIRVKCLILLSEANALNKNTCSAVENCRKPSKLLKGLRHLKQNALLTQNNIDAIVWHYKSNYAAQKIGRAHV